MPRDYSKADGELAQQLGVSPRQVEHWRSAGCLKRPTRVHATGMPGSRSGYPAGTAEQAERVRDLLAGTPRLLAGSKTSLDEVRIVLFWEGRFVDPEKLRGSYQAFLRRLDGHFGPRDAKRAADIARLLSGQTRRGFGLWASALKAAVQSNSISPRERVRRALPVLLAALSGTPLPDGPVSPDDQVTDAVDHLGFGVDDAIAAEDLAFVNLARVREVMNEAEHPELEQARELIKTVMTYAQDVAFIASCTGRMPLWPAFSLIHSKVIKSADPVLPLCLPFAVAARRQYGPRWDDHIAGLARQAEAAASLLRALPRELRRLVPAEEASAPARHDPGQLAAFHAAYTPWAEQHPDLALLLQQNTHGQ